MYDIAQYRHHHVANTGANKFYVDKLGYSVDENVDDSDGVHILRKRINDDDSI